VTRACLWLLCAGPGIIWETPEQGPERPELGRATKRPYADYI